MAPVRSPYLLTNRSRGRHRCVQDPGYGSTLHSSVGVGTPWPVDLNTRRTRSDRVGRLVELVGSTGEKNYIGSGWASPVAIAAPMPRPAPVISAVLPARPAVMIEGSFHAMCSTAYQDHMALHAVR